MSTINRKNLLLNILILFTVASFCLIGIKGEHINGFMVVLLLANAVEGNFFYGILPLIGVMGMMISITPKNKKFLFALSFFCQFIPVYLDLVLHYRQAFSYASYYLPFALYIVLAITCFLIMIFGEAKKPDLANELFQD